ncbi:hypothetical protein FHP25_24930 [Vineibacter terrae]|uniref:Uncharacterized protein n=1 Tax=Vineibacter terrae TaxID=2586908 RepID=A0A5C8PFI5_9HYPH|nr:hypothetical protein [Vineibacter terrae]TXL72543.1 hypothetical protein FHP25_24930 [Vineibacter terrae]
MATREEIIAAIETAKCPSHELDEQVARLLGWTQRRVGQVDAWFDLAGHMHGRPPLFTKSLDDAARLIPVGAYWFVGAGREQPGEPLYGAVIIEPASDREIGGGETDASAASALTIAGLRAQCPATTQH